VVVTRQYLTTVKFLEAISLAQEPFTIVWWRGIAAAARLIPPVHAVNCDLMARGGAFLGTHRLLSSGSQRNLRISGWGIYHKTADSIIAANPSLPLYCSPVL
jgi:hypothetical protein